MKATWQGSHVVSRVLLVASLGWTTTLLASGTYKVVEVKDGATVRGQVTFAGIVPEIQLPVTKNQGICCAKDQPLKKSPRLVVNEAGFVKNTVISLVEVHAGKPFPEATPLLDQKQCSFEPHVVLVPRRANLAIRNSDPVLHSVHGFLGRSDAFNLATPHQNRVIYKRQRRAGIIAIKCEVGHPWMSAYVVVMEHPYHAVTDENGRFEIDQIPAGKYVVRVWHEGWKVTQQADGLFHYDDALSLDVPVELAAGETRSFRVVLQHGDMTAHDEATNETASLSPSETELTALTDAEAK